VPTHAGRTFLLQLPYSFFRPALSQASAKKIHFHRQLSDLLQKSVTLAPQRLYLFTLRFLVPEDDAGFLHELFSPFRGLLGRYLVLLGKSLNVSLSFIASNTTLILNVESYLLFLPISSFFFTKIRLFRHLCLCLNSGEHYTYRIYDFDRQDKDGNKRQLHTSEALNCLDYNVLPNYKTYYEEADNKACRMVNSPFFKTSVYKVTKPLSVDLSPIDSFVIWIGIEGSSQLKDNEGNVFSFSEGETILIPATTQKIEIEEPMKFLQVFI